ncbi:MAG: histidinol-phosphatase HisJ family protein [Candidatus Nanoarchaeia archaeon]|nr:histidinol-phosphatase HisJ family protein [Candidatus Nanoarchaeia archaeon]
MLYDCHVHTFYSGHSENYKIAELKEEALRKGVEISIREHAPFPQEFFDTSRKNHYQFKGGLPAEKASLTSETLPLFFNEMAESNASLGFEVDILPGFEKKTEKIISMLEKKAGECGLCIDGINGSHHYYNGIVWDSSPDLLISAMERAGGCRKFIRSYFGQIRDAMKTGLYDAISHLELPIKFSRKGSKLEKLIKDARRAYLEELSKTFFTAKENNAAIEYNTSGIDNLCSAPYLSESSLNLAYSMNVPLTIGSDTHAVRHVGRHFDFAVRQLKKHGIKELHYFRERKRISYKI